MLQQLLGGLTIKSISIIAGILVVVGIVFFLWRTRALRDELLYALRENGFVSVVPVPPDLPIPFYTARSGLLAPGVPVTLLFGTQRGDESPVHRSSPTVVPSIGVVLPNQPKFSDAWLGRWEKLALAHNTAFTTGDSEAPDYVTRLGNGCAFLHFDTPHTRKAIALLLGSLRSKMP